LTIANHIKTIGIEEYHAGPGVSKSDLDIQIWLACYMREMMTWVSSRSAS